MVTSIVHLLHSLFCKMFLKNKDISKGMFTAVYFVLSPIQDLDPFFSLEDITVDMMKEVAKKFETNCA